MKGSFACSIPPAASWRPGTGVPFAREVDGALVFDGGISREEDAGAAGPRATEQTFDAANPTHLAGAQRIVEATRHLNDVFPS